MSHNLPGEVNPFEAPRAGIGEDAQYLDFADLDAETIRRAHLGRESNIKSLGRLMYLGAIFAFGGLVIFGLLLAGMLPTNANARQPMDPAATKTIFGVAAVICFVLIPIYGSLGFGLTRLQTWARWTVVVLDSLALLNNMIQGAIAAMVNPAVGVISIVIGSLIPGFVLWLLVSSKAGMVFSPEYKVIIRKTPHIKQKMSIIVKILLGILLALVLLGVIGAIIGSLTNR